MNPRHLDEMIDSADLPAIIQNFYPESKAIAGKQATIFASWRGNNKTPSCSINKHSVTGVWFFNDKGNASGKAEGNVFQWLTEVSGTHTMQPKEAFDFLVEWTGIQPQVEYEPRVVETKQDRVATVIGEYKEISQEDKDFLRALYKKEIPKQVRGRGFKPSDLAKYGFVGDKYDNTFIPVFAPNGSIVGIKVRTDDSNDMPRYYYKTEEASSPAWCNPDFRIPENTDLFGDAIYIIEGEFNGAILDSVCREHGDNISVMALAGKNGTLYNEFEGKRVYLYLDDIYSKDIKRRNEARLAQETIWNTLIKLGVKEILELPSLTDTDFCKEANKSRDAFYHKFLNLIANASPIDYRKHSTLGLTMSELHRQREETMSPEVAYPTGFREVDNLTLGFSPNGTTLIAALSGHGKSTLMRQAAFNLAERGTRCKIYACEESIIRNIEAMASLLANVTTDEIKKPVATPYIKSEFGTLEEAIEAYRSSWDDYINSYYKKVGIITMNSMLLIGDDIRKSYERGEYEWFGIDYVQAVVSPDGRQDEAKASVYFADLASELNVPIVLGTQLSKSKFDHHRMSGIPNITDIHGSGDIYRYCDSAWFIYNQDMYMDNFSLSAKDYRVYEPNDSGKARIINMKPRRGNVGWRHLRWEKGSGKMRSLF